MLNSDEIRKEYQKYKYRYNLLEELDEFLSEKELCLQDANRNQAMLKMYFNTLYTSLKCECREGYMKWDNIKYLLDIAGQMEE